MTRCAHANCYCEADDSSSTTAPYCSPYCANADAPDADPAAESSCACQHSSCGVEASRQNSRDRSSPIAMGGGPGAP